MGLSLFFSLMKIFISLFLVLSILLPSMMSFAANPSFSVQTFQDCSQVQTSLKNILSVYSDRYFNGGSNFGGSMDF